MPAFDVKILPLLLMDLKEQYKILKTQFITPHIMMVCFFSSNRLALVVCTLHYKLINQSVIPLISSTKGGCFSTKKRTLLLCFDWYCEADLMQSKLWKALFKYTWLDISNNTSASQYWTSLKNLCLCLKVIVFSCYVTNNRRNWHSSLSHTQT